MLKKKLVEIAFLGLHKFSNLNVSHQGFLLQDWIFIIGLKPCYHSKGLVILV